MSFTIREARPDEHDEIARITLDAYALVFDTPQLGDYGDELSNVGGRARHATVLVAEAGGRVVGAVTYVDDAESPVAEWPDPDAAGFRMLAVEPAFQGSGAGRALTHACIARARDTGKAAVILHTTKYMQRARGMYERLGFVRYPAIDICYDGVDVLGYRLDLHDTGGQ